MIISGEGGKQKSNKKQHNPAALTGTVVKQKSLTASPQKQVKKSPDKLVDLKLIKDTLCLLLLYFTAFVLIFEGYFVRCQNLGFLCFNSRIL